MLGIVSGALVAAIAVIAGTWTPGRTAWIADTYTVWTEPSPGEVVALADAVSMSDGGRLIYLASTPELETESFNEHCAIEGEIVLGCYVDREIYLFVVTDERLAGTTEITAAHEMLHAAYERLGREERDEVDALVAAQVAALPEDHRVFEEMDLYPESQKADEWHSRLATEVAELSPELEEYYARYFDDRSKVIALFEMSTAQLVELENRIDALVAEIDELDIALTARSAAYDAQLAVLNADIDSFNLRADTGQFSSQAEFDRQRAALTARSDALEAERLALNSEVDRYNELVAQLEALDADYADLYESLDSTPPPPPEAEP